MGHVRHFDLIIIGTGSGNAILDERFADWDVAVVEKGVGSHSSYGGTCLNVGCIPTKMFVHTADVANSPTAGERLGVGVRLDEVRWREIRDRVFGRIDTISESGKRFRRDENPNVTLYEGTARFTAARELRVETAEGPTTISADRVVIAAGGRPVIPEIPGIEDVDYHTSDSVMRLESLPESMIIMGTGFIGAEFAHIFSALGVRVTMVGRSGRVLRSEDVDISERFTELAARQWDLRLNRREIEVSGSGEGVRLRMDGPEGAETLEAGTLLVATGRRPNSDLLDTAAAGIETAEDGKVKVDSTQRTTVEGVWALGDVSSEHELKHVANHEERVVQHNLLHPDTPIESDHRFVPHAVFSEPQIASVGLTEQQAAEHGIGYVTATQDYGGIAYGWAMEDTSGFAKLLAAPSTGKLLGAHIIGPQAPTVIQPLIQAMEFGIDARTMARGQYWIHPAMPELVENALLGLPLD
ncbi:mycothione reductase [Actinopolyspora mzabensis]|uniref:Mycothione reductase n=1 Tax=Actinopolyspora mzabensis TaxID=995066 RepID=A0A1G8YQL6_ACTMZ|nr:mycothione reductase [Actinopolyspora mzabensis]SDK05139.1 mycothione reductase [Actinopolyspora mzabensis]